LKVLDGIHVLTCLVELSLSFNYFVTLPTGINYLLELEVLNVGSNKLEFVDLRGLTKLRVLQLDRNRLIHPPLGLEELINLETIDFQYNAIEWLPSLSRLTKIKDLRLHWNQFVTCAEVEDLIHLESLVMSHNALSTSPNVGHMQRLTRLWSIIHHCLLSRISRRVRNPARGAVLSRRCARH